MISDPEKWPAGKWINTEPFAWRMPNKPGVYVILFGKEAVYIGQTNNLRLRLARHNISYGYARNIHTTWGEFPDSVMLGCKVKISRRLGDWAMWEIRLIQRLQPRFNVTMVKKRRAANG